MEPGEKLCEVELPGLFAKLRGELEEKPQVLGSEHENGTGRQYLLTPPPARLDQRLMVTSRHHVQDMAVPEQAARPGGSGPWHDFLSPDRDPEAAILRHPSTCSRL